MSADKQPRLGLTDELAVERTLLANERTLLAYVRTSLALIAGALTLLKFFTSNGMHMLGYTLLPIGVATLAYGMMTFHEVKLRVAGHVANTHAQSQRDEL